MSSRRWIRLAGSVRRSLSLSRSRKAQLEELRAAEGGAFGRHFLRLMTTHHDGAITMATDVKARGNDIRIEKMADDVIAQQTSEISRMRAMS